MPIKKLIFRSWAPFTSCIGTTNNTDSATTDFIEANTTTDSFSLYLQNHSWSKLFCKLSYDGYQFSSSSNNIFKNLCKNLCSSYNFINYDNIRKIATGKGDDYTTGCLLHYNYFKNYYKIIAIDLRKQQALDVDSKAILKIDFTRNLEINQEYFSLLTKWKKLF